MVRKDMPDIIYKTEEAKLRGIATEILQLYCRLEPVLVGTRSIEMSERVSARLTFQALEVLGATVLLRNKLEEQRKTLGDKYPPLSALVNTKIDDLNIAKLAPVGREVSQSLKMLDKDVLAQLASALGIENDQMERLEEALTHGIPHNILNAKYHEQEARIIAEAGRKGAVTIATNMAGRGVDIVLGGTHYNETNENAASILDQSYRRGGKQRGPAGIAHTVGKNDKAADPETLGPAGAGTISLDETDHDIAREREDVKTLGGLYILGTERHESRRIDNQLRGRSGRQGDPGVSKFHVSLEDYLWRVFGDRSNSFLMKGWEEDQAVDMKFLSTLIERAQKKVEQHNFDSRKHVLEYDDVMNVQRERIYADRRAILEGADLRETLVSYLHGAVDDALALYCPENIPEDEWDRSGLFENLNQQFPLLHFVQEEELDGLRRADLAERLHAAADQAYEEKEAEFGPEVMRDVERYITIREIDQAWVHHLADMDYLREGIGLRGYGQVDPLVAYKKEALELFEQMQAGIQSSVVRNLFMAQVQFQQPEEPDLYEMMRQMESGGLPEFAEDGGAQPVGPIVAAAAPIIPDVGQGALLAAMAASAQQKQTVAPTRVGPNDPCPCGSGLKYKKCCRNK
jgi:preprotein translocase subunit SecA